MTEKQQQMIALRVKGYKFSEIAEALGVSQSAVRMFCTRNQIEPGKSCCKNCGGVLKNENRVFCSDECRNAWWKEHRHKDYHYEFSFTCKHCRTEFKRPFNNHQKYCSHACYIRDRYAKEG